MILTFSKHEFKQRWQESRENREIAYYTNGFETGEDCPPWLGQGRDRNFQLRNGLHLCIDDYQYWHPFSVNNQHDKLAPLTSRFYLSGNHRVTTPGVKGIQEDYAENAGQNYLFFLPDLKEIEQWSSEKHHNVRICLDLDFLRTFCSDLQSLAPELRQLIEGNSLERFHQPLGMITPAMQLALHQIFNRESAE